MKAFDIFCASPASTAICLSLDQRALVRQGSRVLEQSRLLERQGSRNFEPSNTVLDPGRRSKSERPRRSSDRRRSKSINTDNINSIIIHNSNNNNSYGGEEQKDLEHKEQKQRRSRHRSSGANALSRFSCSAIDQMAITPFQQPLPPRKPVKTPAMLHDHAASSACSSPAATEVVVLRVSLHCQGCAGKVRKHISKMEGVTSFTIDLERQKVTIVGNIIPGEVRESVSRVKNAEFWHASKA